MCSLLVVRIMQGWYLMIFARRLCCLAQSDTWFYLKAVLCGSGAVFSTLESRMSVWVVDGQPFSNGCCIEFRIR